MVTPLFHRLWGEKNEDISPVIENPFYFFRHPFILGGNVKYTITPQTILYNRQQGLSSDVDFFPSLSCVGLACDMTEESFFY